MSRMKNIINKLRMRLRQEAFLTTPLAILISPVYIVRRGLYKGISKIAPKINGNILDIGCGSKPYESIFSNVESYIGVDIEVSGHDHRDSKVDLFYDGKTLPFSDDSFDCIVCFEVLEHVFNIDEFCAECSRVLKPNGLFLATVPFVWEEHEIPYDFARYTSYGIIHIFQKNNLQKIELIKSTTYILTVSQLFISFISKMAFPRSWLFRRLFQIFIIFPLNLMALFFDFIFPKRYSLYCNNILLCKKL